MGQPWVKTQIVSPLGTASPYRHTLHRHVHAEPVQARVALPKATLQSLNGASQCVFFWQCNASVQMQWDFPLRVLSTQLQAGQVPTGKGALLCVAYIGFPSGMNSFPLVGIKKKSEVPGYGPFQWMVLVRASLQQLNCYVHSVGPKGFHLGALAGVPSFILELVTLVC